MVKDGPCELCIVFVEVERDDEEEEEEEEEEDCVVRHFFFLAGFSPRDGSCEDRCSCGKK